MNLDDSADAKQGRIAYGHPAPMAAPMSHTARQRRQALRRADVALYTAKTDGGSRVEIAPPTLEPSEAFPAD